MVNKVILFLSLPHCLLAFLHGFHYSYRCVMERAFWAVNVECLVSALISFISRSVFKTKFLGINYTVF